jgi:glycosyltransferase involved in cell wall biosynthesis
VRIVLLVRALTLGGAERQLVNLATGLHRRAHAVSVAVFYRSGSVLEDELAAAGVELIDLGKHSRWDLMRPVWRLLRHVAARRAEVVYSFLPTANVLAGLLWGWRRAPAVVAGFRGTDTVRASHDWLGELLVTVEDRVTRRCAGAIANSQAGADARADRGWSRERLNVVRNGLDLARHAFEPAARTALRTAWAAAPGEPVIGFAGRLDPVKGMEVLLDAVATLRAEGIAARLVVAGDGNPRYAAGLHARAGALGIGDAVTWLGQFRDMRAFHSAIDVLCLPSHSEGCSNVLGEALAAGTPAVATAVGDARWLLGDDAPLVAPGDAAGLAAALSATLAAGHAGRAARADRARRLLALDAMLAGTEKALAAALGRPAGDGAPDVMVVTMVFPWPSEAFAGVEVRALRDCGARVRVRALRGRHARAAELLRDWRVADVDVSSATAAGVARGLAVAVRHPLVTAEAIGWLLARSWRRPLLAARCLLLALRMLEVFAECRRRPPDVLYLFWGHYPSLLGHLVLRRLPGVHVAQSLGAYDLVYHFPPAADLGRRAHSLWTIARCNLPAFAAQGLDPARVRVAPHALDFSQVPPPTAGREPLALVTVARLEENKGLDDVLRMAAAVRAAGHDLRVTVIGEGPDRRRLQVLAASLGIGAAVVFTGSIPHSDVYGHLRGAALFALLSRSPAERLPNAVKEALVSGCLCVVTRTPGIEDLLVGIQHPMVVEQGDWRAAVDHVLAVLADPGRFEPDRARGREHMLQHFDARAVARERLRVWAGAGTGGSAA